MIMKHSEVDVCPRGLGEVGSPGECGSLRQRSKDKEKKVATAAARPLPPSSDKSKRPDHNDYFLLSTRRSQSFLIIFGIHCCLFSIVFNNIHRRWTWMETPTLSTTSHDSAVGNLVALAGFGTGSLCMLYISRVIEVRLLVLFSGGGVMKWTDGSEDGVEGGNTSSERTTSERGVNSGNSTDSSINEYDKVPGNSPASSVAHTVSCSTAVPSSSAGESDAGGQSDDIIQVEADSSAGLGSSWGISTNDIQMNQISTNEPVQKMESEPSAHDKSSPEKRNFLDSYIFSLDRRLSHAYQRYRVEDADVNPTPHRSSVSAFLSTTVPLFCSGILLRISPSKVFRALDSYADKYRFEADGADAKSKRKFLKLGACGGEYLHSDGANSENSETSTSSLSPFDTLLSFIIIFSMRTTCVFFIIQTIVTLEKWPLEDHEQQVDPSNDRDDQQQILLPHTILHKVFAGIMFLSVPVWFCAILVLTRRRVLGKGVYENGGDSQPQQLSQLDRGPHSTNQSTILHSQKQLLLFRLRSIFLIIFSIAFFLHWLFLMIFSPREGYFWGDRLNRMGAMQWTCVGMMMCYFLSIAAGDEVLLGEVKRVEYEGVVGEGGGREEKV